MHRSRHPIFYALLCLLLAACSRDPQLTKLQADDVIVAFGDSLTYGTGTTPDSAYPAVLAALIHHPVVNAGVPGETTSDAMARLPQVLADNHPRLVLLCLGGNDMLQHQPASRTETNLRAMVATIRASGAGVLLIGVPEPRLFGGTAALYANLADKMKLPYEGKVLNDVLRDPGLKSDEIHANAKGYRIVAERVAAQLQAAGAL
jgi:acyl-CoA thioesterase-1